MERTAELPPPPEQPLDGRAVLDWRVVDVTQDCDIGYVREVGTY